DLETVKGFAAAAVAHFVTVAFADEYIVHCSSLRCMSLCNVNSESASVIKVNQECSVIIDATRFDDIRAFSKSFTDNVRNVVRPVHCFLDCSHKCGRDCSSLHSLYLLWFAHD